MRAYRTGGTPWTVIIDAEGIVRFDDFTISADDAEVLFTLMAERYERRSLVISSNLVFSQWDRIFGNPMATAAAFPLPRGVDEDRPIQRSARHLRCLRRLDSRLGPVATQPRTTRLQTGLVCCSGEFRQHVPRVQHAPRSRVTV